MKRNEIAKLNSAQAATNRFGIGMLTPTLIVLLVMTAYPLIFTFVYSFTDYNYLKGTENASFVLFDNYVSLFKNGYFQQAVWNTIKFTILAVVLEMALGLLIAVFVNSLKRVSGLDVDYFFCQIGSYHYSSFLERYLSIHLTKAAIHTKAARTFNIKKPKE